MFFSELKTIVNMSDRSDTRRSIPSLNRPMVGLVWPCVTCIEVQSGAALRSALRGEPAAVGSYALPELSPGCRFVGDEAAWLAAVSVGR